MAAVQRVIADRDDVASLRDRIAIAGPSAGKLLRARQDEVEFFRGGIERDRDPYDLEFEPELPVLDRKSVV